MTLSEDDNMLVAKGIIYIDDQGKKCYSAMETPEKGEKIRNFKTQSNAVMVVGYPKTGSHLILSILDELGIERMEQLGEGEKLVTPFPLEYQPSVQSFEYMEKHLADSSKLLTLPHCHSLPSHFPQDFKGKIVFIERDPRAVAVSGYHFFKRPFGKYMELLDIKDDVNKFAKHLFEGKFLFGRSNDFDDQWKSFAAQNPNLSIIFTKYEDILADKASHIKKIAAFLGIENYNLDEVVTNTSIEKAKERRGEKLVKSGHTSGAKEESILYRSGKANSWSGVLSEEVLQLYEKSVGKTTF